MKTGPLLKILLSGSLILALLFFMGKRQTLVENSDAAVETEIVLLETETLLAEEQTAQEHTTEEETFTSSDSEETDVTEETGSSSEAESPEKISDAEEKTGEFGTSAEETSETAPKEIITDVVATDHAEYSYEEMDEDLKILAEQYPDWLSYSSYGTTADGRNFYVAVLGNPNADKQLVIEGGIHAREYLMPMLVMKQLEYYLENMETGTYNGVSFKDIFSAVAVYIIPMANPDGTAISEFGLDGIRSEEIRNRITAIYEDNVANGRTSQSFSEYLRRWKANANGVDLNRNYGCDWESVSGAPAPANYYYKGETPETEVETKATEYLINSLSNVIGMIGFHSTGSLIYWDCKQSGDIRTACYELAVAMSRVNGYTVDNSYSKNDAASCDWAVLTKNIPAITIETGVNVCPLSISEFPEIWRRNRDIWAAAILHLTGQ